jgi:lysophospholipase L1-like esterase
LRRVIWDYTLVSTNLQGLRSQRPVGPKRPGSLRIVCLGDSVTFGYRVPVVFAERPDEYDPDWLPYPELIEKRLRQANPGREIETVALAVPGYSSYQGRAWLARDIERLAPDIVTANFGWNDVGLRSVPDSRLMRTAWGRVWMRRLLARSQALIRASLWLEARGDPRAGQDRGRPRVSRDEFVDNHLEIARLAREHRARALIVGPVYRDDSTFPEEAVRLGAHRRALREAMIDAGIPYLQIELLTEAGSPANHELFGELIHPNHRGHRLMASAVLESLASHGMLEGYVIGSSGDTTRN